jgi:rubredoxin
MEKEQYTCPCCGYMVLNEEPPGTYDICSICYWEDDPIQFDDPDYGGGANKLSLRTAQANFAKYGYSDKSCKDHVRKPTESDKKDPKWVPLK